MLQLSYEELHFMAVLIERRYKTIIFEATFFSARIPNYPKSMGSDILQITDGKEQNTIPSTDLMPHLRSHLEANFIFFSLKLILNHNPPQEFIEKVQFFEYFALILSLFPNQQLILHLKLQRPDELRILKKDLSFTWTADHIRILDSYENLRNILYVQKAQKGMEQVQYSSNIVVLCNNTLTLKVDEPLTVYRSIAISTEHEQEEFNFQSN
ncbi:unnamed protein product [Leptosia nina]|uniref:Uncharacterized protein n=1 Tax=Leptosia nina TaxID=320188 RepID=A0AAV1JJI1_9NEOP